MKTLLWLYHVFCFVCYRCAVLQMPRLSMSSSSMTGNLSPVNSYIDIPWLASMPGNCQGIVLTPWLILSTANCLKKSKPLHLDISGVNDPESIPQGQRICLHPKFNPNNENDPVKADIGLVILEEPISGDEIPLSQSSNISLKSCSKCQYKSCYVYEYQSSQKLGTTRVKKIEVQLLDFSTCHHQHSNLEKTVGLCIQSQPREDCWIQRASPVLCLLKNRWELVGLIHKTSRICQNPTVIIRTTPYFSWIKRFIKASKKLLNPTSSLHCRTLYENEHVPQIRHSHNYIPTLAPNNSSLRVFQGIGISPQAKITNNVPTIFNFSDANYFPDSHRLFLYKTQTPQPVKPLPIAGLPGNFGQNLIQYHQFTPPHNTD
ncbi:serine protease 29-like isoform X2 [Apodemus sylvaticus]|uniref:serine protease 29-like isoform X2 n=1 Tax=Apodemus sylvaticus TaxID=10129 RepID=UPI0022437FB1|nr:serine protease 29-like isoform X2 [Apodemus sylvaticus]